MNPGAVEGPLLTFEGPRQGWRFNGSGGRTATLVLLSGVGESSRLITFGI
jgi:hypothetical protein